MLTVIAKKQRLVLNHLSTLQLRQELHCHPLLSSQQLFPRLSQPPSSQPVCHRRILPLPLVFLRQLLWQVLKARRSKDRKEMHSSANMVDIPRLVHRLVHKTSLRCLKSRMTHSVNRLLLLKAHSRATRTSNLSLRVNPNLAPSLLHPINSPLITLLIRNSVMLTITITSSNMDCNKALRHNKKVLHHSNDPTAATMDLKQRAIPNFRKVLPNLPSHVTQLQERLKPVATRPPTQLLSPSNQELLKEVHHNKPATNNNHRLETIHMATPTTPARTILRT